MKTDSDSFNRREDDFVSLLAYNDYLEKVENFTWNLINGVDVEETEKTISAYAEENRREISRNESVAAQEAQSRKARAAEEQELTRLRREDARREDELEREFHRSAPDCQETANVTGQRTGQRHGCRQSTKRHQGLRDP